MKTDPSEWADRMTIREHFAALAMQGIMACPEDGERHLLARACVQMADALIAALNEEEL